MAKAKESEQSLLQRLKLQSRIKESAVLSDSTLYSGKVACPTPVPMVNVALSGTVDGGLSSGLIVLAGPSKHFKTAFGLLIAGSYLKANPDAILIFYDNEFGSPQSYFEAFGIDPSRVLHVPIMNIEELKFDLVNQLDKIDRKDKVIIMIDSVGNLASKKELDDAMAEKSVADMTRAKALKSLFRMTTPYLTVKDIPMIVVNHTYKEQGLFPKDIVSGGCVAAGTEITLPDGSTKPVEEFLVGEEVMTLEGSKEITHTWCPDTLDEGNPECYEIEFEDGYVVTVSDKHKFLIDNEWVEAKDLGIGCDCAVINLRGINENS